MPVIRITVDGKLALTVAQLAAEFEVSESGMRDALNRAKVEPAATLLGRPVYEATSTRKRLKTRPGKGNWGKR